MSLQTLIDDNRRAIDADPIKAKAVFSVKGDLIGLTEVELTSRQHSVRVDEPPPLGGQDLGANPVEHALIALASCQAITYRFWAAKLEIELDGLEVTAEGDLDVRGFFGFDDSVRAGFTAVRLEIHGAPPRPGERRALSAASPTPSTPTARCSTCSQIRPRSSAGSRWRPDRPPTPDVPCRNARWAIVSRVRLEELQRARFEVGPNIEALPDGMNPLPPAHVR